MVFLEKFLCINQGTYLFQEDFTLISLTQREKSSLLALQIPEKSGSKGSSRKIIELWSHYLDVYDPELEIRLDNAVTNAGSGLRVKCHVL